MTVAKLDLIYEIRFFFLFFLVQAYEICKISVLAIFDYTCLHCLPLHYDRIVANHNVHKKIFVAESTHIAI